MVVFKTLRLQNILSFGNKETSIDFTRGINFITGENGCGKSSILDSLSFCLYGKPYRDIVIKSLINWVNKKNLKTECEFDVGEDSYKITRTLSPDNIIIYKNGDPIDLRASKSLVQEEIDKILGVNYKLFKQIISLHIVYNKSFLVMSAAEKREVLEQLFNIKVFSDMLKDIKKENVEIKHENDVLVKSHSMLSDNISSLKKRYDELIYLKDNFEKSKSDQLDKLKDKLSNYSDKKNKLKSNIETLKKDIEVYKHKLVNDASSRFDIFVSEVLNPLKYEASAIKTSINNFRKNTSTECEFCGKPLTKAHIEKEISKKTALFDDIKIKSDKALRRYNRLNALKFAYSKIVDNCNRAESTVFDNVRQINFINSEISAIELEISEVNKKVFDANIDSLNDEINNKISDFELSKIKIGKFNESLKVNSIIVDILSDSGIKSYFMSKIIPVLNGSINEYLKKFELPVKIKFSDAMEVSIVHFRNPNKEVDFNAFSEGQKKRIDLAILFSFIDVVKTVCNWNCNLFMIDELLDTSIDEKGLDKVLDIIHDMVKQYSTCVYIISHRIQNTVIADRSIKVFTNNNGFADVEVK